MIPVSRFVQGGLGWRLARGGSLLAGANLMEQGLRVVRNMILARLLVPDVFGVMALALSLCSLAQAFTEVGIREAVMQHPRGGGPAFLRAAWWAALARGLVLYALVAALAPLAATFFGIPELTLVVRVAFLRCLAESAMSPGMPGALRDLRYGPWAVVMNGGGAIGVVATLGLALVLPGVWALVAGHVIEGLARLVLSYLVCPVNPAGAVDREAFSSLARFAKGMAGLPILAFVFMEAPTFAVGKLCSRGDLGVFALALALGRIPMIVTGQVGPLILPAFAGVQGDADRLHRAVCKATALLALLALPAALVAACFARELLVVVYGASYAAGAGALAALFASQAVMLLNVPLVTCFVSALGRPGIPRRYSLLRAGILLALLWPFIRLGGITGAGGAALVAMLVAFGAQAMQLHRLAGLSRRMYARSMGGGIALSVVLAPPLLFVRACNPSASEGMRLVYAAVVVLVVAAAVGWVARRRPEWALRFWPRGERHA